jgi:hypothetical protein
VVRTTHLFVARDVYERCPCSDILWGEGGGGQQMRELMHQAPAPEPSSYVGFGRWGMNARPNSPRNRHHLQSSAGREPRPQKSPEAMHYPYTTRTPSSDAAASSPCCLNSFYRPSHSRRQRSLLIAAAVAPAHSVSPSVSTPSLTAPRLSRYARWYGTGMCVGTAPACAKWYDVRTHPPSFQ